MSPYIIKEKTSKYRMKKYAWNYKAIFIMIEAVFINQAVLESLASGRAGTSLGKSGTMVAVVSFQG